MKSKFSRLTMIMALASIGSSNNPGITSGKKLNPKLNKNPNMNPNGLTKFIIDGKEIYALNEKNAIRKANKNK